MHAESIGFLLMPFAFSGLPLLSHRWGASFPLHGLKRTIYAFLLARFFRVHHDSTSREIHWIGLVQLISAAICKGFQHLDLFQLKWVHLLTKSWWSHCFSCYLKYERVVFALGSGKGVLKCPIFCLSVLFLESSWLVVRSAHCWCGCFICQLSLPRIIWAIWVID